MSTSRVPTRTPARSTPTVALTRAKNDFKEAVSALLHEGLTAEEIHALVNDVIKNGL
jgi:hypothetical protein